MKFAVVALQSSSFALLDNAVIDDRIRDHNCKHEHEQGWHAVRQEIDHCSNDAGILLQVGSAYCPPHVVFDLDEHEARFLRRKMLQAPF